MDNRGLASWEIVYTAPNQAYIDKGVNIPVKLDDTLQTGLDIVKDSIQVETKLKGQDQVQNDNSQIQTTDTGFTYAIADDVETIKIKYNTQLTDEEFAKALAGNNNTTYTNTVKAVDLNEAPVLTKNANVNTNAIKMIISKKAYDVTYHAAEGGNKAYYTLDWEIDIDAHDKQLTELNLSDILTGQAIIISPKIMETDENFKKLDMKIQYAEGNYLTPIVEISRDDLELKYNDDKSRVTGFNLDLTKYLGTDKGKIDTTKKFKITYRTQVDDSYLASFDPSQIDKQDFKNTVSAGFQFGEVKNPVTSNEASDVPDDTIDPLITISSGGVDKNKLALKWNVTINPPRKIPSSLNMTEILFEDTFAKIKSCPDSTKRNDYQSFGWNEEKRNEQIENIREQIEKQFTDGSNESLDITLTEDDDNYILNIKLKNTGTKQIAFSYYTYGTNPYIWGGNMNQNFSYKNNVKLLKSGTSIDGQAIITDITATASQNAGGGQALVT